MLPHGGAGLGQEVLNDHLLHMAVSTVTRGNGFQCFDAIELGVANADQDARGERDLLLAGCFEGGEAASGGFVAHMAAR